jgi:predicted amidohydrolase
MKVAIGQFSATPDKDANFKTIVSMAEEAASLGAELVVFPEYAMFKQVLRDAAFLDACEPLDGPFPSGMRNLAARLGINLIVGLCETIPGERRGFNTVLVISAKGEDLGLYRKIHLYDAFGGKESTWIRPGGTDQPLVMRIGELTCGMMICYDIRFPELTRRLVDEGADVIVCPTAWTPGVRKEDHWLTLVRARAIENTAYMIGAGQAPPMCTGGSLIVDPMGIIVAEAGENQTVIIAEVSPERVRSVRTKNPSLEHRRYRVVPLGEDEWLKPATTE